MKASRRACATLARALALGAVLAAGAHAQAVGAPDTVMVRSGQLVLRGLLWHPAGRAPAPAVLFNHGSGPAADPRRAEILGATFARRGYAFLHLYRRGAGPSADQGVDSETLMERARAERGQAGRNAEQLRLLDAELADVRAGLAALRARPGVDPRRVAVAGHSFGGSLTLLIVARDTTVRAAVVFGAAAVSWETSPELRERLRAAVRGTRVPVLFVYAANDHAVAPGEELAGEMARAGVPHGLRILPPVGRTPAEGHDLVHRDVPAWAPDVFAFLAEHVRP